MKIQKKSIAAGKCAAGLVALGVMLVPGIGGAQTATLSNNGSQATVDLGSSAGMNSWSVSEQNQMQNQLNQQWFWYSVNGGPVQAINTIGGLSFSLQNNGNNDELSATYSDSTLAVNVDYLLAGGGVNSGSADITEAITIVNNSASAFNLKFFQYSYFDLLGSPNSIQILGTPGQFQATSQTTTTGGNGIAEVIDNPNANFAEAGAPGQVMTDLTSGNDLGGPYIAGPGNVAWSFEWTASVDPGLDGAFTINKDKNLSIQLVPEPSTFALIGLGLGAIGLVRRRQAS